MLTIHNTVKNKDRNNDLNNLKTYIIIDIYNNLTSSDFFFESIRDKLDHNRLLGSVR